MGSLNGFYKTEALTIRIEFFGAHYTVPKIGPPPNSIASYLSPYMGFPKIGDPNKVP